MARLRVTSMNPAVAVWFASAVLLEVESTVLLYFRLRSEGVTLSRVRYGFPGHLETLYMQRCRARGRAVRPWIALRVVSVVNVVAATAAFIGSLARGV